MTTCHDMLRHVLVTLRTSPRESRHEMVHKSGYVPPDEIDNANTHLITEKGLEKRVSQVGVVVVFTTAAEKKNGYTTRGVPSSANRCPETIDYNRRMAVLLYAM